MYIIVGVQVNRQHAKKTKKNELAVASLSNMDADGFTHGDEEKRAKKGGCFKQRKVSEAHLVMRQASGTTPKPKGLLRPDIDVCHDTCNKSTCFQNMTTMDVVA